MIPGHSPADKRAPYRLCMECREKQANATSFSTVVDDAGVARARLVRRCVGCFVKYYRRKEHAA